MKLFYINRAQDVERRRAVEALLDRFGGGREAQRVDAIDGSEIKRGRGALSAAEIACALSHRKALSEALHHDGHAHIIEDDVLLGNESFQRIDQAIASIDGAKWDLLYTDLIIPSPLDMVGFFGVSQSLRREGRSTVAPLRAPIFAGAASYIVNRGSKRRLLRRITERRPTQPFDLLLRDLIVTKTLRAFVALPFPTSISARGLSSTIQGDASKVTEAVWTFYRNLIWAEADANEVICQLQRHVPDDFCAPPEIALGQLIAACSSDKFLWK